MSPMLPAARARIAVLVTVAVYLSWGPVTHQLFGLRPHPLTPVWRMYSTPGRGLCDVTYLHRTDAGDEPLDRLAMLGASPWWTANPSVRALYRPEGVREQARALCPLLPEDTRDLRADARCATRSEWKPAFAREENLCAPPTREAGGGRPSGRRRR